MAPPKSLVPRHYGQRGPHCGVSLDIHHSLGPPWGHAGLVKGGCVRVACPEDAGPFVTPELFLLVCKPSCPSWELPEASRESHGLCRGWMVLARGGQSPSLRVLKGSAVLDQKRVSKGA